MNFHVAFSSKLSFSSEDVATAATTLAAGGTHTEHASSYGPEISPNQGLEATYTEHDSLSARSPKIVPNAGPTRQPIMVCSRHKFRIKTYSRHTAIAPRTEFLPWGSSIIRAIGRFLYPPPKRASLGEGLCTDIFRTSRCNLRPAVASVTTIPKPPLKPPGKIAIYKSVLEALEKSCPR